MTTSRPFYKKQSKFIAWAFTRSTWHCIFLISTAAQAGKTSFKRQYDNSREVVTLSKCIWLDESKVVKTIVRFIDVTDENNDKSTCVDLRECGLSKDAKPFPTQRGIRFSMDVFRHLIQAVDTALLTKDDDNNDIELVKGLRIRFFYAVKSGYNRWEPSAAIFQSIEGDRRYIFLENSALEALCSQTIKDKMPASPANGYSKRFADDGDAWHKTKKGQNDFDDDYSLSVVV